jgi:hypothetical protein
MNKSLTAALICAAALVVVPPASAGIVPGVAVDGPSAEVQDIQPRVDVAPDGSAALVYLKQVGGVNHPFVSSFMNGAWSAPVDVDPTLGATAAGPPRIAVANGGKVVVTYKRGAGGVVAHVRPATGASFGPPANLAPGGTHAEVDLAGNGNGYAVGSESNDVYGQRLEGVAWTPVAPAVLDKVAGAQAGFDGNTEPRVATAPDGGSAVVAWAEVIDGAMQTDVFARRLTGIAAGPVGAGAHIVTPLPGADPYAGMLVPVADQPDVDIDAAGTAWVGFRQNITYGGMTKHRAFTRPFSGDAYGGAQLVDSMPEVPTEGRDLQRIDINDAGQGLITHHGNLTNPLEFATLAGGAWTKGGLFEPAPNATVPLASPAIGQNGSGLVAYKFQPAPAQPIITRARTTLGGLGAELTLSGPALGEVVSGSDAAAGPGAFGAVTFVQRTGLQNSIVAAIVDLPQQPPGPGNPTPTGDTTAPNVTGLRLSRKRFRLGSALPSAAAVRTGTVIRFRLSEAATVRLSFSRPRPGRRVGSACRKPTRRNRSRRRCTRFVNVRGAVITRPLGTGARQIKFAGRVSRRRSLKPGPYRLTVTARDGAGNASLPDRARFTLLKKQRRRAP